MNNFNKKFIYFICMVSAMGGLLFGYDWVVIGGAKPFYELYFDIADSPLMQGVAMTTALVGCLIGAQRPKKGRIGISKLHAQRKRSGLLLYPQMVWQSAFES